MIHLARPTVQSVINIIPTSKYGNFSRFLKSDKGRTDMCGNNDHQLALSEGRTSGS